jgi:hypothetical protein
VTVEADSGDIAAEGIDVREAHVRSDSGDIGLDLAGRQSVVWAHTDSGDVETTVAAARGRRADGLRDVEVTVLSGARATARSG